MTQSNVWLRKMGPVPVAIGVPVGVAVTLASLGGNDEEERATGRAGGMVGYHDGLGGRALGIGEARRGNARQCEAMRGNARQCEAMRGNARQCEAMRSEQAKPI
jgi:hypothetical protein